MANVHFLRKMASDELWDTLFFATGQIPTKEKSKDFTILKTDQFSAKIFHTRRIEINKEKCKSVGEAKLFVQENI